jgi:hypothetical protein
MRRQLLLPVCVLALLFAASAQATTQFARRAKAQARADAAHELAAMPLPRGAQRVHGDQSVNGDLRPDMTACVPKYVVDDHAYWRVPGKPADVSAWIVAHPPAQVTWTSNGELSDHGAPTMWSVDFGFRATPKVHVRGLFIAIAAAKGGGSAIRADGVAVWSPRRGDVPCAYAGSY